VCRSGIDFKKAITRRKWRRELTQTADLTLPSWLSGARAHTYRRHVSRPSTRDDASEWPRLIRPAILYFRHTHRSGSVALHLPAHYISRRRRRRNNVPSPLRRLPAPATVAPRARASCRGHVTGSRSRPGRGKGGAGHDEVWRSGGTVVVQMATSRAWSKPFNVSRYGADVVAARAVASGVV